VSKLLAKVLLISGFLLYFGNPAFAQSEASLTLSSATALPGSPITLTLSLASPAGSEPAAVQWTLSYSPVNVASINVTAGDAAAAAGKNISCAGQAAAYICIASGMNADTIANGAVAVVSLMMTGSATTATIGVSDTLGASPAGEPLAISGTSGIVILPLPEGTPATVTSLSCSPASVGPTGLLTCTLNLSAAAGSGGAIVALSSTSSSLMAPAYVTVPAGASSSTFSSTTSSFSSDQAAVITATLNGSSANTSVALVAPVLVSAMQCAASSLAANSNTSCTVTLSKAAPAAGS
jgi:hypothetical protein